MLDKRNLTVEEKTELVGKAAKRIGQAETRLHGARDDLAAFETMLKKGYELGIVPNGTDCMVMISRLGRLGGAIAAVEEELYSIHAKATAWAQDAGVDVGGLYAVLKPYAPEIMPRDGGR